MSDCVFRQFNQIDNAVFYFLNLTFVVSFICDWLNQCNFQMMQHRSLNRWKTKSLPQIDIQKRWKQFRFVQNLIEFAAYHSTGAKLLIIISLYLHFIQNWNGFNIASECGRSH